MGRVSTGRYGRNSGRFAPSGSLSCDPAVGPPLASINGDDSARRTIVREDIWLRGCFCVTGVTYGYPLYKWIARNVVIAASLLQGLIPIEDAFGNMKTGMRGVYKKISPRYLRSYFDAYSWRHNAQRSGPALFEQLLQRAASN